MKCKIRTKRQEKPQYPKVSDFVVIERKTLFMDDDAICEAILREWALRKCLNVVNREGGICAQGGGKRFTCAKDSLGKFLIIEHGKGSVPLHEWAITSAYPCYRSSEVLKFALGPVGSGKSSAFLEISMIRGAINPMRLIFQNQKVAGIELNGNIRPMVFDTSEESIWSEDYIFKPATLPERLSRGYRMSLKDRAEYIDQVISMGYICVDGERGVFL